MPGAAVKTALVLFAVVMFAALIVLAVVFRSGTARDLLRILRNMAYAWVVLVVVLAIFELRRRGI